MISPVFLWLPALLLVLALLSGAAVWIWKRRPARAPRPLPSEWRLSARPVFSSDERRVYRLLRDALPNHAILSKLPLVRFSQPDDPNDVRYWYELLGTAHVAFAICSANGRVLAAIDLDSDHGNSRRTLQVKQAVLAACRVRYLRCPMDNLPTAAELQSLVPPGVTPRTVRPAPAVPEPTPGANGLTATGRPARPRQGERDLLWQDSVPYHDSFFALENRPDGAGTTDFAGLGSTRERRSVDIPTGDDIAGIVSDDPRDLRDLRDLRDRPPRR